MMLLLHILLFLAHAAVPCFSKIVKVEDTDIFEKIQFYLVSREWERPESERREEFRISEWDVSSVTDMSYLFAATDSMSCVSTCKIVNRNSDNRYCRTDVPRFCRKRNPWATVDAQQFNADLSKWNTRRVTAMNFMFSGAWAFNSDLSAWQIDQVGSMQSMFQDAISFNSDISKWNVGSVTNAASMFNKAWSFNADISSWNFKTIVIEGPVLRYEYANVNFMLDCAASFNRDIRGWSEVSVVEVEKRLVPINAYSMNYVRGERSCLTDDSCGFCRKRRTERAKGSCISEIFDEVCHGNDGACTDCRTCDMLKSSGLGVTCGAGFREKDRSTLCTECLDDGSECCTVCLEEDAEIKLESIKFLEDNAKGPNTTVSNQEVPYGPLIFNANGEESVLLRGTFSLPTSLSVFFHGRKGRIRRVPTVVAEGLQITLPKYEEVCNAERKNCGYVRVEISIGNLCGSARCAKQKDMKKTVLNGVVQCSISYPRFLYYRKPPEACTSEFSRLRDPAVCHEKETAQKCSLFDGKVCPDCPSGGFCLNPWLLWPQEGFFVSSYVQDRAMRCSSPSLARCRGWNKFEGRVICGRGYSNEDEDCERCNKGFLLISSGECAPCPTFASQARATAIVVGSVFVFSTWIFLRLSVCWLPENESRDSEFWRHTSCVCGRCALRHVSRAGKSTASVIGYLLATIQVLSTTVQRSHAYMPDLVKSIFDAVAAALLDVSRAFNSSCATSSSEAMRISFLSSALLLTATVFFVLRYHLLSPGRRMNILTLYTLLYGGICAFAWKSAACDFHTGVLLLDRDVPCLAVTPISISVLVFHGICFPLWTFYTCYNLVKKGKMSMSRSTLKTWKTFLDGTYAFNSFYVRHISMATMFVLTACGSGIFNAVENNVSLIRDAKIDDDQISPHA